MSGKAAGRRGTRSTSDKLWASGLAVATCAGLVGVMAVRMEADASVQASTPAQVGSSQAQLDTYAAQLAQQADKLAAYQAQLSQVAAQLNARSGTTVANVPAAVNSGAKSSASVKKKPVVKKPTVKKPALTKPAPKPAPLPQIAAPAPRVVTAPPTQSVTRGS